VAKKENESFLKKALAAEKGTCSAADFKKIETMCIDGANTEIDRQLNLRDQLIRIENNRKIEELADDLLYECSVTASDTFAHFRVLGV
jgi:hypothetical protein